MMGRATTAGMPIKTAKISAMTIRSGPMSLAKLARNIVIENGATLDAGVDG
jgi:hypothetical protein